VLNKRPELHASCRMPVYFYRGIMHISYGHWETALDGLMDAKRFASPAYSDRSYRDIRFSVRFTI